MLIGLIRPVDTIELSASGKSLIDIRAALVAQLPPGFDLTDVPLATVKGSVEMTSQARAERIDGVREIQAETMPALEASIPEGYRLLSVRKV